VTELLADAEAVGAGLLARYAPGARSATRLRNGPAAVLLQLGVALSCMTLVPVNPWSRPAELEHALRLSGAVPAVAAEEVAVNPVADLCAAVEGVEVVRVSAGLAGGPVPGDVAVAILKPPDPAKALVALHRPLGPGTVLRPADQVRPPFWPPARFRGCCRRRESGTSYTSMAARCTASR
jgi:hypothetical protein